MFPFRVRLTTFAVLVLSALSACSQSAPEAQVDGPRPVDDMTGPYVPAPGPGPDPAPRAMPVARMANEIAFQPWTDPIERAFDTELPQGWQVQGGMLRQGVVTSISVVAADPRNGSVIFVGAPPVTFVFPTPSLQSLGYSAGQSYSSDGGRTHFVVQPFLDAAQFGAGWFGQNFGGGQVVERRQRPDLDAQQRRLEPVMGGAVHRVSAADVDFKLADGRFATMTLVLSGQELPGVGGTWRLASLYGFISAPDRVPVTARALGHAVGSIRVNPQWFFADQKAVTATGQQYLAALHETSQRQQAAIEERWASQDARGRQERDLLGGTTRVTDPATGQQYEVRNDSKDYYGGTGANAGTVVGTDIDQNPDPTQDYRRLDQVGVDVPDR